MRNAGQHVPEEAVNVFRRRFAATQWKPYGRSINTLITTGGVFIFLDGNTSLGVNPHLLCPPFLQLLVSAVYCYVHVRLYLLRFSLL